MRIKILKDEFWYGGCTSWGTEMPIGSTTSTELIFAPNQTPNQAVPLLLSSKGRFLWLDRVSHVAIENRAIVCDDCAVLGESGSTLRSAYLAAMQRWFPFSGKMPAEELFSAPIFNTWIEMTFNQNQEDILQYAHSIVENGFKPGVLMIDDGWSECYGDWSFHTGRFPDPSAMLDELHKLGFSVMLWICPYITPDTQAYREALSSNVLLKQPDGRPYIAQWWNGFSAALNISSQTAQQWLAAQLDRLQKMGVDGFKFDGGDPLHYAAGGCGCDGATLDANELCRSWALFGESYPFNEYRVTWKAAGRPLFQRLCDKEHSWGAKGLAALVPDTLAQGITGHPFGCADMVGGGEYLNFLNNSSSLDGELFVRHAAVSCLMPAIQFSAAPWRILTDYQNRQIQLQLKLRSQLWQYLKNVLYNCCDTGEPVVRYMEYEFPHQGLEAVCDQFMVGDSLLVAPVLKKGDNERSVFVPAGKWIFENEILESQGGRRKLAANDTAVIVLKRCDA
ncbi:glycoside hydrolase family 31 protein [Hydrogenoanaerobacterium sp.]|uniref:glycoside hydrolase family 31 protein n=1 Tax=Hydrogenoanaerobacterium sp. TaxID=2953763 RepID=UPI0028A027C1|nr:glycoside hydrolase family 31 protein [Hydrogenoanaerobacterium sp.]